MASRLIFVLLAAGTLPAQRFYSDDPLDREPTPIPVNQISSRKLSDYYDFFSNQFHEVGDQPKRGKMVPAMAVNTCGEPMEGSWYTRRHYYRRMSREELQRGPGSNHPPSLRGKWIVVAAKTEGITPGFQILDADKRRYFIKFDPISNPEMATAADAIGTRFFHALGYHVPDNYLVTFRRDQLELDEGVQITNARGQKQAMTQKDLDVIFAKVPLTAKGDYRATASLALDGKPVGPPRYYGTRKDDPNDVVPHEHRRELRGLHVFSAWLDHDDSRAINNLDSLVTVDGVPHVRHYLLDFGSTLGSASSGPNSARSGTYLFSWKDSAVQLFTLGLKPPSYALARYPDLPSVGRFESKRFDPRTWVPEYPNVAFDNRLPDDEFWAAKQVMAFTDSDIDAIVATGQLSDAEASAYLSRCLRERRDKIGSAYFAKVLPLDRFRVSNGQLEWDDLGAMHNLGPVENAELQWNTFDNHSNEQKPIAGATGRRVPEGHAYVSALIRSPRRKGQTVTVFIRHGDQGARVVGVDRTW